MLRLGLVEGLGFTGWRVGRVYRFIGIASWLRLLGCNRTFVDEFKYPHHPKPQQQ